MGWQDSIMTATIPSIMAKKKKAHRKTNFSYTEAAGRSSSPRSSSNQSESSTKSTEAIVKPISSDEVVSLTVVRTDLKQVFKLAIGFIVLELVLWYVLQHTGLGTQLYSHFK